MPDRYALGRDWYKLVIVDGVDVALPGIYEWRIEGVGAYIGKYKRIRRATREYGRNVTRLLSAQPYRKSKPDGFRNIHRALAQAVSEGHPITLTILENVRPDDIDRREQEMIAERGTLNATKPSETR